MPSTPPPLAAAAPGPPADLLLGQGGIGVGGINWDGAGVGGVSRTERRARCRPGVVTEVVDGGGDVSMTEPRQCRR